MFRIVVRPAPHVDRTRGLSKEEMSMTVTRRIANAGVCAAIAGGVVLAAGSSAMAATPAAAQHYPVLTSTTAAVERHDTPRQPADPWIAGQLAAFYPSAAHRLAAFDPWVKDQLALSHPGK
ncbi:hypothetical protein [Streptomyces broussonetiae]|uniref:Uncharacterized protein n=1 Tax=Streptomyces broussonetiae TaxID=2686304 RepID=A0A6I6MYN3_9ACTN|nr:hypothetical protein [Streptomyces broussonetiae]QHA02207.1 hypothetical protein GQF42_01660 [Streptomyces broussonetiae]